MKNYKYTAKAKIDKLTLKGKYMIDGKVLILPIKGDGDSLLTLGMYTIFNSRFCF